MDQARDIERTDTGINTVEGNVAGARAGRLTKKRDEEQAAYEKRKKQIQEDAKKGARNIDDRFNSSSLTSNTTIMGLYTKEQYREASAGLLSKSSVNAAGADESKETKALQAAEMRKKAKKDKKSKKRALAVLSFDGDESEETSAVAGDTVESSSLRSSAAAASASTSSAEPLPSNIPKKRMKNPNVATDFLPDREREEADATKRAKLKEDWLIEQERLKAENLEITYSYWDGSGHRRTITCTKGTSIGKFLEKIRHAIAPDFHELRSMSSDGLLYIKEDLIIPHHFTFYDLIVTKARGKSGPLFHFDVHDDVRIGAIDSRVEKDESHPGKVVQRGWYERNKHIFPASRWEVYDPKVERNTYTIHGGEVN
jgi:protein FAM50